MDSGGDGGGDREHWTGKCASDKFHKVFYKKLKQSSQKLSEETNNTSTF